jgi:aquaporin Z
LEHALAGHWPEYLIEATCLGLFMLSACVFTVIVEHPASSIRAAIPDASIRRFIIGVAMGLSAITLIYSPIGKRSGAHMNPAITLTFYRLGKIEPWDAVFYVMAQFLGGVAGTALAFAIFRSTLVHPQVNFVVTSPGMMGTLVALAGEIAISFLMMSVVLTLSNSADLARYTGLAAGLLVMMFITFEAPISGMSMNPARSFASDFVGMQWNAIWIYFAGPLAGMLAAAELYVRSRGKDSVLCAKLDHSGKSRCIFHCGYVRTQMKLHTA